MKRTDTGFSLLELLIVVAIILIIATIAIPNLLRSRQAAHESAAVATLRTINTAQVTYLSSSGSGNFGTVSALISAGLLDSRFSGVVSGYNFTITAAGADYTADATPASSNDGRYGYYSTPDAVVRYSTAASLAPAGRVGLPVQ